MYSLVGKGRNDIGTGERARVKCIIPDNGMHCYGFFFLKNYMDIKMLGLIERKINLLNNQYAILYKNWSFEATWMELETLILSEVRKTNTIWYHLYLESNIQHK